MTVVVDKPVNEDFTSLADPYRRELLAHCYRMLGSVHDAEDLVQETYLRAWRAYDRFEGRSSLRTWLYRIATSACLTALEGRNRRPMPTGLGGPSDPDAPLVQRQEVPWLEPVPDSMVESDESDPATVVTSRESIRLAFIAALQHLPVRQRAVLILRDVLKFRAAEVAETLDITTTAVNSLLQRARAQLEQVTPDADGVGEPLSDQQRELLDRYVAAFEKYNIPSLVDLFTSDAAWEMPPYDGWWEGPENIVRLIQNSCPAKGPGDQILVATTANGQPAFGLYMRDQNGVHQAFQLQVIEFDGPKVSHVAVFFDTSLFTAFGLPKTLNHAAGRAAEQDRAVDQSTG